MRIITTARNAAMTTRPILIGMLLFFTSACSDDIETELIGHWEGVSLQQNFTFYQDGRVKLQDLKHGTYQGRYHISENDLLTCEFEQFSRPVIRTIEISGDTLILHNPKSTDEKYRRKN
jgi:hypothetical protein